MANRPGSVAVQVNNHRTQFLCSDTSIPISSTLLPLTLNLPAPSIDSNQNSQQYSRINNRTRGGDLILFRASYWPKSRTISMTWNDLNSEHRNNLLRFLKLTLGKLLTLNSHDEQTYTGIILNPDTAVKENSGQENENNVNELTEEQIINRAGNNSVTIEFETVTI